MNIIVHVVILCPSNKPPGHNLPRNAWVCLNRLRLGWAKTASFLAKIGATNSEWCLCGGLQRVHHIINACPLFGAPSGPQGIKTLDPATNAWLETQLPLWQPLLAVIKRTTMMLNFTFCWKLTRINCNAPNKKTVKWGVCLQVSCRKLQGLLVDKQANISGDQNI